MYVSPGTPPDPPVSADRYAGSGVRVLVVDTGFDKRAAELPWLIGVTGDDEPGIKTGPKGTRIKRYAGHGTFIAGVIRTVAPAAEVIVRAGLPGEGSPSQPGSTPAGTSFERELVTALERYLDEDRPDIISLSAGTLTESAQEPLVLHGFQRVLRRYKGVGALAADRHTRAHFSNYGAWVDAYAPGERLVNAFPSGVYKYTEPPNIPKGRQRFRGMAIWSGTSFSTPVVAGLIAARMSHTGENGVDAAAALMAQARNDFIPGTGPVLRPS